MEGKSHCSNGFQYEWMLDEKISLETMNLIEKRWFMEREKDVTIIAPSSGISLHNDRREKNKKSRVYITLELPWCTDRAIQQFVRTHRSNQISAPKHQFFYFRFGRREEIRFYKRLESLGALTHGDRWATESRDFNFNKNYGRSAMEISPKTAMGEEAPLWPPLSTYQRDFMKDAAKDLVGTGLLVEAAQDRAFYDVKSMNKLLNMNIKSIDSSKFLLKHV